MAVPILDMLSSIVAVYFEGCSHISASNEIKAIRQSASLSSVFEDVRPASKGYRFGVKCAAREKNSVFQYSTHDSHVYRTVTQVCQEQG